ncbi:MAG: cation diffusion facilitator family transporter [Alphaproteobacteria bacterium]|nr:cation diffusion facilitator family transporter [Alphaproteobacteria bacterium]
MSLFQTDLSSPVAPSRAARLMRIATYASVGVAAILIAVKTGALYATGATVILATLIDSILDGAASLLNLVAVRHSLQPADEHHRFGHGKAEALAGLGQAAFIGGSAVFLGFESVQRLFKPQMVEQSDIGIIVTIFALVLTIALVAFQRYVSRVSGSLAIGADALHYASDIMLNLGVIAGLVLAGRFALPLADPLIALGISGWIGYSAMQIFRASYDQIMDRELPDEDRKKVREIALGHDEVMDIHDVRSRLAGTTPFIQLHLEMQPNMSLHDAHEIADEVEAKVKEAFPGAEVIIHQDPAGLEKDPAFHD